MLFGAETTFLKGGKTFITDRMADVETHSVVDVAVDFGTEESPWGTTMILINVSVDVHGVNAVETPIEAFIGGFRESTVAVIFGIAVATATS